MATAHRYEIVSVRLDFETARAVRRAAKSDGRNVSGFLRVLIERALATQATTQPAAESRLAG